MLLSTLFDLDRSKRRSKKPRSDGLTMMMDKGMGVQAFQDLLELAANYIDFIKLGFGTLSLTPRHIVQKKISLANQHHVSLYPGGTFFEWFAIDGKEECYFQQLCELGFKWVEISDGTISMDSKVRAQRIQTAKSWGLDVITEIGKKKAGVTIPVPQLIETYRTDIAEGASCVIIEGRETGENIGVFNREGEIDTEYVHHICQAVPPQKLIWEAPKKAQQVRFIQIIGDSANLGNISPSDILSVESLRRGLRADTFDYGKEG